MNSSIYTTIEFISRKISADGKQGKIDKPGLANKKVTLRSLLEIIAIEVILRDLRILTSSRAILRLSGFLTVYKPVSSSDEESPSDNITQCHRK